MSQKKKTNTDGRPRSRQELEKLRREAVRRVLEGESPEAVIKSIGLHRSRIYAWLKAYRESGEAGLEKKSASGRPGKFTRAHEEQFRALAASGEFDSTKPLWTVEVLKNTLRQRLGISLGKNAVNRLLEHWGLEVGRPVPSLSRGDSAAIRDWLGREYRSIHQQALKGKGAILFCRASLDRATFNSIQARTPGGTIFFELRCQRFDSADFLNFITGLLQSTEKDLFLVVEDEAWRAALQERPVSTQVLASPRIKVFYLPQSDSDRSIFEPDTAGSIAASQVDLSSWLFTLYQSLLSDYPLDTFLDRLQSYMGGDYVGLSMDIASSGPVYASQPERMTVDQVIASVETVVSQWPHNPLLKRLTGPGTLLALSEVVDWETLKKNEFYQQAMKPYGQKDILALTFAGPGDMLCGLFVFFCMRRNGLSVAERQLFAALQPHIEIAIAIMVEKRRNQFAIKALEEAMDHLKIASIILDGKGEVIKTSQTADELLLGNEHLYLEGKRLTFSFAKHQTQFLTAVKQSIAWRHAPLGPKPISALRFEYRNLQTLGILIQPITPLKSNVVYTAVVNPHVVVYISQPGKTRPDPDRHLIAALFDLSVREAQLVILLANGHTLQSAASAMSVTESTIRTYLKHIYGKVGVNRQTDLIQQVMKSVALLA